MTRSGRLFQTRAAATGKARSPTVGSRVPLTINDEENWKSGTVGGVEAVVMILLLLKKFAVS